MSYTEDDFLEHYGVKGMKWGQRRAQKRVEKAQKKWDKKVQKQSWKAYNQAAHHANEVLIPAINKKYGKFDFSDLSDPKVKKAYDKYLNEYDEKFTEVYQTKLKDMFGDRPE